MQRFRKQLHTHLTARYINIILSGCLILSGAAWAAVDATANPADKTKPPHTIQYLTIPGVDKNLLSLDIYPAKQKKSAIVIFVHGGGWMRGDKSRAHYKPSYFNDLGFTFVSVNYRLSPNCRDKASETLFFDPQRIKYPVQPSDVAEAYAWIQKNAARFNADPTNITIMGHSAGSGIASLLATDESFITKARGNFSHLKGVILLDGDAYDIADKASEKKNGRYTRNAIMYHNAFASPEENTRNNVWGMASPINYIRSGLGNFFIVTQGSASRVNSSLSFEKQLQSHNIYTELLNVSGVYSHKEINTSIGDPQDHIITPRLTKFLKTRILN